jgi:hypothetical protein
MLLCAIAVSVSFGIGIWFLDTQVTITGDETPYRLTFGPFLPGIAPTLIVTVFPLLSGAAAFLSKVAHGMPRSSAMPLLLLSLVIPVVVSWYAWSVLGDWMWLSRN